MTTTDIIIIGGSGFALECFLYVKELCDGGAPVRFAGFAAAGTPTLEAYGLMDKFIGSEDCVPVDGNRKFVIAIGSPNVRKAVYEKMKSRGAKFINLVAPSAFVLPEVLEATEASIFCPHSTAISLKFGIGNVVNSHSTLAHDTLVGDFNVFSAYCDICGQAKMGDLNFFGSHASMLPLSKIGNGNRVGAGSIVYKKHGDNQVLLGNPAESVGTIF